MHPNSPKCTQCEFRQPTAPSRKTTPPRRRRIHDTRASAPPRGTRLAPRAISTRKLRRYRKGATSSTRHSSPSRPHCAPCRKSAPATRGRSTLKKHLLVRPRASLALPRPKPLFARARLAPPSLRFALARDPSSASGHVCGGGCRAGRGRRRGPFADAARSPRADVARDGRRVGGVRLVQALAPRTQGRRRQAGRQPPPQER